MFRIETSTMTARVSTGALSVLVALVINSQTYGNRTVELLVRNPVHDKMFLTNTNLPVPVGHDVPRPFPTSSLGVDAHLGQEPLFQGTLWCGHRENQAFRGVWRGWCSRTTRAFYRIKEAAMQGDVTVAELSSSLIRVFEGCRLTAYQDTGGVWTIGFGHTGKVGGAAIFSGMTITQEQADQFLQEDLADLFSLVKDLPLIEAAALVSFGYNCGKGALERVMAGHSLLTDFVHDRHQRVLPALVARRTLEQNLILASQQVTHHA